MPWVREGWSPRTVKIEDYYPPVLGLLMVTLMLQETPEDLLDVANWLKDRMAELPDASWLNTVNIEDEFTLDEVAMRALGIYEMFVFPRMSSDDAMAYWLGSRLNPIDPSTGVADPDNGAKSEFDNELLRDRGNFWSIYS